MKRIDKYWRPVCHGNCFECPYPDCIVPATDSRIVERMTNGGVKTKYLLPRNSKSKVSFVSSK